MSESTTAIVKVQRFESGDMSEADEKVITESRVTVFLNGREIVRLLCLPDLVEELTAGFLCSECLIQKRDDIGEIVFNPRSMSVEVRLAGDREVQLSEAIRSITTGCGHGVTYVSPMNSPWFPPITATVKVTSDQVISTMRRIQKHSVLFHETGGVHSALAANAGEIGFAADDIGRHNAVDKVIGSMLRAGRTAAEFPILALTGRVSSEIITKAVRGRFPILISPSAVTSGAIQLGEALGVTVIGFARGQRFNVYSHPSRVVKS